MSTIIKAAGNMKLHISTSCLKDGKNVFDVLAAYRNAGLKNIELGTTHRPIENLDVGQFRQYNCNFLVHHYFPPPRESFILNLASQDARILTLSREQIKKSLDFCQSLGVPLLTFHGGFRADPDNKLHFNWQSAASHATAINTFLESVREINDYAAARGIRIAIENNVLSDYNLVDGQNKLLLFCEAADFTKLWESLASDNVGILLDLGHLKVTAHWLGFNRYNFINEVRDRVFAIHIHENNGLRDQHQELDKSSWCLEVINRPCFGNLPVVLETFGLNTAQILGQVSLLESVRDLNKSE